MRGSRRSAAVAGVALCLSTLTDTSGAQDATSGVAAFQACSICHSVDPSSGSSMGPNLGSVFGRRAGTYRGYPYSAAMAASGITWDTDSLDQFLAHPEQVVPGTKMSFAGVQDPAARAQLIQYLAHVAHIAPPSLTPPAQMRVPRVAASDLKAERLIRVELKAQLQPHWVWVNDISFTRMTDGRAYLIDADNATLLGMVSGGLAHGSLQLAPDGRSFAVPATFYSRGTRGVRTDVVTFYDSKDLAPGAEVVIPPKRLLAMAFLGSMPVLDDGRFSIIYNFTPQQSLTIIDNHKKMLVGEFATPGCALAYPIGARRFFMQCGDGSLQNVSLDEAGQLQLGAASSPLFQRADPANEKPVRVGKTRWLLFTFNSQLALVDAGGKVPTILSRWSMLGAGDEGWRLGGTQPATFHAPSQRLFALMHRGGPETHKDPGTEIWVFDLNSQRRAARFVLEHPLTSIAISEDAHPLLYGVMAGSTDFSIFDPDNGRILRAVHELGDTMTVIQPSPVRASGAH